MSDTVPSAIHLTVVTPKLLLVEADVESVSLPSLEGQLGILPGHRSFFIGIGKGPISYRIGGSEESHIISGGYAEIRGDKVRVVTEVAEDEDAGGRPA